MTPRTQVPARTQERARNAAQMANRAATALTGFTTYDGAVAAEIAVKRAKEELNGLLGEIRAIKSAAKREGNSAALEYARAVSA